MIDAIGVLVVLGILFALCQTQDKVLDAERDFWIKVRKRSDRSEQ